MILVDDGSPKAETRAYLRELAHPQIRAKFSLANQGISGATNAALDEARGDYVVFLDNDDVLTPDCLFELAERIAATDADYVYSDEDKLDASGAYVEPFFKPDWSPDTMMSTMYTCHVSCARRSLVEAVGRLGSEFDGAQDYDLILRVTERANRIEHIAKVLYHWRILPTSTAGAMEAKPYAIEAAQRCKEEALLRRGLAGEMEYMDRVPGQFRVNYHPDRGQMVSIVIPSKNNHAVLRRCLDSIRSLTAHPNYEIVLIDNDSTDPATLDYVGSLAGKDRIVSLCSPGGFNFSAINNLGVRHANGRQLLFLNDDTEVLQPDWLDRMAGYAQLRHVGAVGAKLLYPNGFIQHCGVLNLQTGPCHAFLNGDADYPDYFGRHLLEYNWTAVTAACLMVDRDKFLAVGGFDEAVPVAYNDVELCFRLLEHGWYNVVCQAVRLVHHESLSRGADVADPVKAARLTRDWRRLYAKHPQMVDHDAFHSPNLMPLNTFFSSKVV